MKCRNYISLHFYEFNTKNYTAYTLLYRQYIVQDINTHFDSHINTNIPAVKKNESIRDQVDTGL